MLTCRQHMRIQCFSGGDGGWGDAYGINAFNKVLRLEEQTKNSDCNNANRTSSTTA